MSKKPPGEEVSVLGPLLFQIHVNDNNGEHQQNLISGDGTFNFYDFFYFLHEINYDGFIIVELAYNYSHNPEPALMRSLRNLQLFLSGKGQNKPK